MNNDFDIRFRINRMKFNKIFFSFYEKAQKALHRIKHKLQYYVVVVSVSFVSFHIMYMDGCIWMYSDVINGGGKR